MKKLPFLYLTILLCTVTFVSIAVYYASPSKFEDHPFIKGVCLEAPPYKFDTLTLKAIKQVNAEWIAVIPYAFTSVESATVRFDGNRQWWGEKSEGIISAIEMANQINCKVMIKPHLWVKHQGWAGDFKLDNDEKWEQWQAAYEQYILHYAKIAAAYNVPLLCIGTECRKVVVERPEFWRQLIGKIRNIYPGKITYAANWDNYENITFWDQLDYIGIDAYFPLDSARTPSVKNLLAGWKQPFNAIKKLSVKWDKPILFTEYGYRSIDYTSIGHWNVNQDTLEVNLQAQQNAYEALYRKFYDEKWFKGGFLWKWHLIKGRFKTFDNTRFTPQGKPVLEVIKKWHDSPVTD